MAARGLESEDEDEDEDENENEDEEEEDEELDMEGVDDPDGVLGALLERLQNGITVLAVCDIFCVELLTRGRVAVVSALNETENENHAMQDEIKQLLADQEEQEELRDELGEQLRQRGELVSKIAEQTLADNESSTDIMERMARLRAESEREKGAFKMEMSRLDSDLAKLMDDKDTPVGTAEDMDSR
eukprot:1674516-Rhodomonas_salina.2